MKSIYSSKLYIASSRKERIDAAINMPGNLSLVQQLAEDLDEEYKTPSNLGLEPSEEASSNAEKPDSDNSEYADMFVDEKIDPKKDLVTVNDLAKGSMSSPAPAHKSEPEGPKSEPDKGDNSELIPESPANEEPKQEQKPVEESTQITSTTIVKPEEKVNLETLKGSLNGRDDTCGVLRIAEKEEKEIWIYYKDDVNLNDIMTNVIEYVANAGFTSLEFNRLARSDNAIVFEVVKQAISIPNSQISEK